MRLDKIEKELLEYGISVPLYQCADGRIGGRIGYASMSKEQISSIATSFSKLIDRWILSI